MIFTAGVPGDGPVGRGTPPPRGGGSSSSACGNRGSGICRIPPSRVTARARTGGGP